MEARNSDYATPLGTGSTKRIKDYPCLSVIDGHFYYHQSTVSNKADGVGWVMPGVLEVV